MIKNPAANVGDTGSIPGLGRKKWQPAPVFLPGKSHGERSLVGYSPRGHKRVRYNLATKQQAIYLAPSTMDHTVRKASQVALAVRKLACQCRRHKRREFDPWVGKFPWRWAREPTPVFLPGESHGQRNLVSCSPSCCKELDTTKVTQHACANS